MYTYMYVHFYEVQSVNLNVDGCQLLYLYVIRIATQRELLLRMEYFLYYLYTFSLVNMGKFDFD